MKKNGFTLVELLAVIVILAVILAIAIPSISGLINHFTKNAFESDAKMVLTQFDYEKLVDDTFDETATTAGTISNYNLSNANYESLKVGIIANNPYIIIIGRNKWAGLKACGTKQSMNVVVSTDTTTCESLTDPRYNATKGVNKPKLASGMTPIKWDGSTWIDTTEDDASWYNYDTTNKQWANAKTADDSMWVWIPRYIYKVSSGWHSNITGTIDVQFSKGIDDNWNSSTIGNINTDKTAESSNGTWTNHPAFTFGSTELTGIWVAKFEPTASEGVANGYVADSTCQADGDNVTNKTIKIIPNATSWRCIQTGYAFDVARSMETNLVYGWGTSGDGIDTHLMKNTEWGALAYLSKSTYGQNTAKIWTNPANNYITGCAGNSESSSQTVGCINVYNTTNGVKASSTGNIYGIYDLAGGAWERIAAYVNNNNSNLSWYGASIINADAKYKDVYTIDTTDTEASNYALTINHKGDAVYETSNNVDGLYSWFGGYSYMVNVTNSWVVRGAAFDGDSRAGALSFSYTTGCPDYYNSFRPVILVNQGL